MNFTLKVMNQENQVLAETCGEEYLYLVYRETYNEGDQLCIETDTPNQFIVLQLEDSMAPALIYLKGTSFNYPLPSANNKIAYSPKNFAGRMHVLSVRKAYDKEVTSYRNVAFNPLDCHTNESAFPHAHANVETRGEAVFAARNAINGNVANSDHGFYPYESWGINRQADAAMTIDFGKEVLADQVVITIRADFPHDNYWKEVSLSFSDGSTQVFSLEKTGSPQRFDISERKIEWVKIHDLIKDENDPSPFPALTQLEVWGTYIQD